MKNAKHIDSEKSTIEKIDQYQNSIKNIENYLKALLEKPENDLTKEHIQEQKDWIKLFKKSIKELNEIGDDKTIKELRGLNTTPNQWRNCLDWDEE